MRRKVFDRKLIEEELPLCEEEEARQEEEAVATQSLPRYRANPASAKLPPRRGSFVLAGATRKQRQLVRSEI